MFSMFYNTENPKDILFTQPQLPKSKFKDFETKYKLKTAPQKKFCEFMKSCNNVFDTIMNNFDTFE